jgi:hypothetical protein
MYLVNKYTTWYNNIISNASNRIITGYTETHHIIPKCFGGTNDTINLVILTAKEHFICHLLLTKMVTGRQKYQMVHAARFLCKHPAHTEYKISSRSYEYLRKESAIAQQNKIITDEFRQKMSNIRIGKPLSDEHRKKIGDIHRGKVDSDDTRKKKSRSATGRRHTEESKLKMSIIQSTIPHPKWSEETRAKMKDRPSQVGWVWWCNGVDQKRQKDCPGDDWYRQSHKKKL